MKQYEAYMPSFTIFAVLLRCEISSLSKEIFDIVKWMAYCRSYYDFNYPYHSTILLQLSMADVNILVYLTLV